MSGRRFNFPQRATAALITLGVLMLTIAAREDAVMTWLLVMLVLGTLWMGKCSLQRRCHHCGNTAPAAFHICPSCGRGLRPVPSRRTRSAG
jgi:hypothetical protein